jgi:hypothetical protein
MQDVVDTEELYVTQMLARAMYLNWCDYKNFTPKPGMYADAGSQDYARVAVDLLSYDEEAIERLKVAVQ